MTASAGEERAALYVVGDDSNSAGISFHGITDGHNANTLQTHTLQIPSGRNYFVKITADLVLLSKPIVSHVPHNEQPTLHPRTYDPISLFRPPN